MSIPVVAFVFESFLVFLVWGVMLVMNLWMFQKTKGQGNLFMMIGAGCLAVSSFIISFATIADPGTAKFILFWLPLIGSILLVFGFYKTAKPVVDAEIQALRSKIGGTGAEKEAEPPAGDES
jgi:hypothetical protein